MTAFLYAEINVFGIILLLLFLKNMNKSRRGKIQFDQYIFNLCMIMNILIFIFDIGMWLTDGKDIIGLKTLNYLVTLFYYICNPLICLLWLIYTDYKIYESRNGLLKRLALYSVPAVVNAALSVISLFTGWLFYIDDVNKYIRGPYFWIMAVSALSYLILSFGIAIKDVMKNGWSENKMIYKHMVIFPVVLVLASIVQIVFFGVSIIWLCALLAFASIYINIQNEEISTDHLTGLYNRRRLDEHLNRRIRMNKKEYSLFIIMLDMDDFKYINDNFGHAEGDRALVKMAEILRKSCRSGDDFIARMGGDEFIIVGERTKIKEIENLISTINNAAAEYNEQKISEYRLMPSQGYSVFKKGDTVDSFLVAADQAMYKKKAENHSIRA